MNHEDRIESFFGWPEQIDEEVSLAEQLPVQDAGEALRIWWRNVMKVQGPLVIDDAEEIIYTALFRSGVGPFVEPTLGMIISVDWWDYSGRDGAQQLYERCHAALQSIGRAL